MNVDRMNKFINPKVQRKILILASYCGEDNSNCSDDHPCPECLEMCNVATTDGDLNVMGGLNFISPRTQTNTTQDDVEIPGASDLDGVPERVLMPRALTADLATKTAFTGQFFVDAGVRCAQCGNPDFSLDLGQCAACHHNEYEPNRRAVPWTTIKRIYAAAVELLSAPAPDEREIANWLSREISFANAYVDKHKASPVLEARAIVVGRTQALQEVRDKLSTRLRAGKEGEQS